MLPDVVLFGGVMALLVTGTRLALARPAYGLPALRGDGRLGGGQVILIAAGACALVAGLTAPGWEALAEIIAIVVAFPLAVTRSWPRRAAALLASGTAGTAWMLEESWVTYTVAAAFIAVAVMTVVRPRMSFRAASAVGLALAAWDFAGVSVTRATVRAATADPFSGLAAQRHTAGPGMPGLIGIPAHAALLSPYAVGVGIGDVALPGILIVIAGRAGRAAGAPRMHAAALSGYGLGLAACLTVAALTGIPLPAMMFLVPGVILMVAATAWRAGAWRALASKDSPSPAAAQDRPLPAR
jgi:hypothetical protein